MMVREENLEARVARLSNLLSQTLLAQETERRVITHKLQEEVGQTLAALALNLRVLEAQCINPQCVGIIGETRVLVADALHDIEHLQRQLYPPALESQGVVAAFEVFIQEFARSAQVQIELDAEVWPHRLPVEVEFALFRILEDTLEHLRNKPLISTISVVLRFVDGFVFLVVEDDHSDDALNWQPALMLERAEGLGGHCAVSSTEGQGTRIEVALPLEKDNPQ
ncbi:MAG: hypothetical protein K8J31_12165 [Anaerolineae bacterium]|nr:hypothetical protein [Anaerolineae bacterium]